MMLSESISRDIEPVGRQGIRHCGSPIVAITGRTRAHSYLSPNWPSIQCGDSDVWQNVTNRANVASHYAAARQAR
jgi:hypothetical protein